MPRRGKDEGDDEPDLWDRVVADVTPLPGKRKAAPKPAAPPVATVTARIDVPIRKAAAPAPKKDAARDLDLRTQQRLQRGQMEIEAILDLHGSGQSAAFEKLCGFLEGAYRRGARCVLVITGKGKAGDGILKARLPEWINEPPLRPIVLKATPARQNHGGSGAFYILLRRDRGL